MNLSKTRGGNNHYFFWKSIFWIFLDPQNHGKTSFLNVSDHSRSLQQFSNNYFLTMNCIQRGDPLRFGQSRYSAKCKGGRDPLRFDQNRIKFSAKRGPFTFWTGIHFPLQFLTKCKGGTLYVLNKVHIKLSKMQRGDPMHFDNFIRPSICYKSRTNKGRFLMKVGFLNFNTPDFSILSLFTGTSGLPPAENFQDSGLRTTFF